MERTYIYIYNIERAQALFCEYGRWQSKPCGCRACCLANFAADSEMCSKVNAFQKKLLGMTPQDKTNMVFDLLRRMKGQNYGQKDGWVFLNRPICFQALLILFQCSKTYVYRLLEAIHAGAVTAPEDGRSLRDERQAPQTASANSFFAYVYDNLAEPLAETVLPDPDDEGDLELKPVAEAARKLESGEHVTDTFSEFILDEMNPVIAQGIPSTEREQRWIPHCKLADLYDQYCFSFVSKGETPCSQTVFNKAWKDTWCGIIRVRRVSQHAKCDSCAKYRQYRVAAQGEEQKNQVQEAYRRHLSQVFADRELAGRYIKHSEVCSRPDTTVPFQRRTLMISLDGMDQARFIFEIFLFSEFFCLVQLPRSVTPMVEIAQPALTLQAKYKLPRNVAGCKLFETHWRPTLHCVGVIIHGLAELYYLSNADQPKDSNAQMTVLSP